MRPSPRHRSRLLLALAVALSLGSVSVLSQTEDGSLLARIDSGDRDARLLLGKYYAAHQRRDDAITQLTSALAEGNEQARLPLARELAAERDLGSWTRAAHLLNGSSRSTEANSQYLQLGVTATLRAIDTDIPLPDRIKYSRGAVAILGEPALAGSPDAKWHLGYLLEHGPESHGKDGQGIAMILNAAEAGHVVAARWTAHLYERVALTGRAPAGLSIPVSDVRAYSAQQSARYADIASASSSRDSRQHQRRRSTPFSTGILGQATIATFEAGVLVASTAPGFIDVSPSSDADELRGQLAQRDRTIERLSADLSSANNEIEELRRELADLAPYRAAVAQADDMNQRGLSFYAAGDFESAVPLFRKATEANHVGAMANLAIAYLNGEAVPQDVRQAEALLKRAAELGNVVAAENLAELYESGAGLGRNPARAIQWYWVASDLGSRKAQAGLDRLKAGAR